HRLGSLLVKIARGAALSGLPELGDGGPLGDEFEGGGVGNLWHRCSLHVICYKIHAMEPCFSVREVSESRDWSIGGRSGDGSRRAPDLHAHPAMHRDGSRRAPTGSAWKRESPLDLPVTGVSRFLFGGTLMGMNRF